MILEKNKLLKLIPVFGAFLILLGVIKLHVYYNAFNVNIFNYLEFTEIITSFLNDIFIIIIGMAGGLLLNFFEENRRTIETRENVYNSLLDENKFWKRFWVYFKLDIDMFLLMIILGLTTLIIYLISKIFVPFAFYIFILMTSLIIIMTFIKEFKRKYYLIYEKFPDSTYFNLIYISILLFLSILFMTKIEIRSVKVNYIYYGTEVTFQDKILTSDSAKYYIGKTTGYIFYYDSNNDITEVYPNSIVNKISIKKR